MIWTACCWTQSESIRQFGWKPRRCSDRSRTPRFRLRSAEATGKNCGRLFYPEVDPEAFRRRCLDRVETLLDESGAEVKLGAPELLAFFRDHGIKIAVASSNSQERIRKNLGQGGLLPFFDAIASN